jgi:tetratricopeptide (TPR) repeat protein
MTIFWDFCNGLNFEFILLYLFYHTHSVLTIILPCCKIGLMAEMNKEDLKEFYNKGVLAFEKKNYDYAVEIFSQILSSRFDHLEARHYLHLALKNKAGETSPSFITSAVNSLNSLIAGLSAENLFKKDNIGGALEKLEAALIKNPGDIKTLKKIAGIFCKKGMLSHTLQTLEEAKSINPDDIDILKNLGEIYLKKEDYANAKSNYEAALKINPHDTGVLKARKNLDALGTIQREFGD